MSTTVQIRIDKKVKESARKNFKKLGLDLSSGIKMYLAHVDSTGEVPFAMFTFDNLPEAEKRKFWRESEKSLRKVRMGAKTYRSAKVMHKDILRAKVR